MTLGQCSLAPQEGRFVTVTQVSTKGDYESSLISLFDLPNFSKVADRCSAEGQGIAL